MNKDFNKQHTSELKGLRLVFRSLGYRNYRLFFFGQSLSLIGTWMQRIALPWLVYQQTGSAFLLGLVGFAGQIPTLLLGPFAGVLTDRWNRYTILIATQILAMMQAFVLVVLYFTGAIQVWHIILLGFLLGSINAFDMPARQAFVVEMVTKKDDLGNAIALNSSMVNSARLIGPSIAGILIAATGEGVCFLVNGLSYIFVIVSLLMMKLTKKETKQKEKRVLHELKEGLSYVFGFAPLRSIILLLGLVSLMGMSHVVLMPVFAKTILHGGPHTFGFLMGASGIGALAGALTLASRKGVLGLEKIIPLAACFFGAGLIALSLSRIILLSMALMLITGFGMIMLMASSNTVLQTIVDDDKRGRMMSFYMIAFLGTAPFGSLMAGGLASRIGAPLTLMLGGMAVLTGAVCFASRLTELKKRIHPIYIRLGILPEVASGIQTATELSVPPEK
jgi:MFS family permease